MDEELIKSLKNLEEFKQYFDVLPEKKLLHELTEPFVKGDGKFSVLSYFILSAHDEGSHEKFKYSLKKLSQVKDFNLADYLNYYTVQTSDMLTGVPFYLLAVFNKTTDMMQDLYDYGVNPNVTASGKGITLNGDSMAEAMSTPKNQSLVEKHNELKIRYLENNLNNGLNEKPSQKKVKL